MDHYRPISLLSCAGKILERIVFKHVFNFFRDNFLISFCQSGFMPGDSTVKQLVHIYHLLCEALDKKGKLELYSVTLVKLLIGSGMMDLNTNWMLWVLEETYHYGSQIISKQRAACNYRRQTALLGFN